MDKFPEAFERFERDVNVDKIETWKQLKLTFGSWAGDKWVPTGKQLEALAVQARKLGIPVTSEEIKQQKTWESKLEREIAFERAREAMREREREAERERLKFNPKPKTFHSNACTPNMSC